MSALTTLLRTIIDVLTFAIILRAILSWFAPQPHNPVVAFLNAITEPVLSPLRRIIPRLGILDLTPFVAIILLQVISSLLR